MKNIALITASGNGTRMGNTEKPKQFLLVKEKPVLVYTVSQFQNHPLIDEIVIVTNKEYIGEVELYCEKYQLNKVKYIVPGGESRQESVFNGLKALKEKYDEEDVVVLIHDAARPLVASSIISSNIEACNKYEAVETVIKATDTIINSSKGEILERVLNRDELYQVQTPQTFLLSLIFEAHKAAIGVNASDDAQLVTRLGKTVHLVEGNKKNFKITTIEDLKFFETLLEQ